MNKLTSTTKATTCLLFFLISFYMFISPADRTINSSSGYYSSILPLFMALLVALVVVFAVRTTIVTWITVMVLLAFAGKRRRVLVKEGRKITSDVAMYLAQVVVKERSLVAFACATIVSLLAMALRVSYHLSM